MYWKSDCALCECVDSKEVCTYDSCRLTENDCLVQDQVLINQEGIFIWKYFIICCSNFNNFITLHIQKKNLSNEIYQQDLKTR